MTNQVVATANRGVFGLSGTRRTRVLANTFQPDGRIRLGGGLAVGDNIYNLTGPNQRRSASVPNRGTATFTAVIQNDGNTTGNFRLRGPGTTSRFTVTYRSGATVITPQVVNGTFAINGLAPGPPAASPSPSGPRRARRAAAPSAASSPSPASTTASRTPSKPPSAAVNGEG